MLVFETSKLQDHSIETRGRMADWPYFTEISPNFVAIAFISGCNCKFILMLALWAQTDVL